MVGRGGFSRYYGSHFNRLPYHFDSFCSRRSTIGLLYFIHHLSRQLWAFRCLGLLMLTENVGGAIATTAFTSRHIGIKDHRLPSLLGRPVGDNKVNCPVEKRKVKETSARRNVNEGGTKRFREPKNANRRLCHRVVLLLANLQTNYQLHWRGLEISRRGFILNE